jgi:hypothetical protein
VDDFLVMLILQIKVGAGEQQDKHGVAIRVVPHQSVGLMAIRLCATVHNG